MIPDKWKKALPFFLSAAAYVAIGVFALLGSTPVWWVPVLTTVVFAVGTWLGVSWLPPTPPEE